jgi:hypothetical protein
LSVWERCYKAMVFGRQLTRSLAAGNTMASCLSKRSVSIVLGYKWIKTPYLHCWVALILERDIATETASFSHGCSFDIRELELDRRKCGDWELIEGNI